MKSYTTMDSQRGHCRPRRHGKTQLVSSLLFTAGMTPGWEKSPKAPPSPTGTKKKSRARSRSNRPRLRRVGRPPGPSRKNQNQFSGYARLHHFHQRDASVADRRGRVADRGGRRCRRAGGHRKSLGLRDRIRSAARVRASTGWTANWRVSSARWNRSQHVFGRGVVPCNCPSARKRAFAAWST